jgi:signal transduction histidine kinase
VVWSWFGRHLDALLAGGLTALGQVEVWSGLAQGGPRVPVAVAVAVGTAAVAVRRSHPISAVIVTCGSMIAQAALGVDENTAFAPLLAAFLAIGTAGYMSTRPLVALGCAVGLIWSAVLISHMPLDSDVSFSVAGDLLYSAIIVALAWFVGRGFAVGRLQRQLSYERAAAAAAQERLRIAREVHDIVAHSISVMALHAGGARRLLRPDQEQAIEALEVVEATGRQALAEIRQVLTDMRGPQAAPLTIAKGTLDRTVEPLRAAGLQVKLVVGDLPDPLPTAIGAAGLRVVQEAVTNVLRHANATAVDIAAGITDGRLILEIVDDGTGTTELTDRNGLGIGGMQERLTDVGGTLEVGPVTGSSPGRGFRVKAVVPLGQAPVQ